MVVMIKLKDQERRLGDCGGPALAIDGPYKAVVSLEAEEDDPNPWPAPPAAGPVGAAAAVEAL